jgi:SPP1 gp7 family putative phage head morphogenesis protein
MIKTLKTELEANFKKVMLKNAGYEAPTKTEEPKPEISEEEKKWLEFQGKQLNVADDYEKKFKDKFDTIFDEQAKEVIAKLDKKELNPKDFLLSSTKEKKRYIRALSELFVTMIVAQSKEAMDFIGQDGGLTPGSPAVINYLSKRAFKFSTPVTHTTNKLLADALGEGIGAGESIPKLQKRIEDIFGEMKKSRCEMIARSETIRATNDASEESYKESGVVEGKRWLAALDERTCEFCDQMNGEVVELGKSFADMGDTFVGRDGGTLPIDYETVDHPPLHPACRCTLIPIVAKAMKVPEQKQDEKEKEILSKLDSILSDIADEK